MPNQLASPTPEKSVLPIAKATAVMMSKASRTDRVPMKPLKRRWMMTMIAIVPKAKPSASNVALAFAASPVA